MRIGEVEYLWTDRKVTESGDTEYSHFFFIVFKPGIFAKCQSMVSLTNRESTMSSASFSASVMSIPKDEATGSALMPHEIKSKSEFATNTPAPQLGQRRPASW